MKELDIKGTGLDFSIKEKDNAKAINFIEELGLEYDKKINGTPLCMACLYDNVEIAKYCIDKGANINAINEDSETPLMLACHNENYELVQILLEKGAKVNMVDKYGKNAFMFAVFSQSNNLKLAKLLLEYGGNPFIEQRTKSGGGFSAYDFVKRIDLNEMMELMESYKDKIK
jgi:ankyrin repeat protein